MSLELKYIETPKYQLKILTPELYTTLFETCKDDEIIEFLKLADYKELMIEKDKYLRGLSTYKISFVYLHICEKSSGRMLGDCGFHTWYLLHNRAEIGYALKDEKDRGKGVMSEILPVLLNYGFETMKLHRIEAMVASDNEASKRLLLKNGFSYEGCLKLNYLKEGSYSDSELYGLLKE